MKKSLPIIGERESEAFILGNGREREFPLTPVLRKTGIAVRNVFCHHAPHEQMCNLFRCTSIF